MFRDFASFFILTQLLLAGAAISSTNHFDVATLPVETVTAKAGTNITLPCPGVNELSLVNSLEWRCQGCLDEKYHANATVSFSQHQIKLVEYNNDAVIVWHQQERSSLDLQTYGLSFRAVRTSDHGDYICLVNQRRRPEAVVQLKVLDVPDPPGRPLIISFTSRSVNLSWAPSLNTHGSPLLHYVVQTRMGEDGDWDVNNTVLTASNVTLCQVIGLLPFTVYSFRVIAVSALGPSPPSRDSYFIVTLREVPDGKPQITSAHNTSSTSINLTWKPPPKSTIHGEFLGYRLAYKQRDRGAPDDVTEIYLKEPNAESYTLHGLDIFTQYVISVQVFNPEGLGPPSTVITMTDEGAPGKPSNVTVVSISDSTISVSWRKPEQPNGIIKGYRIFYMHKNYTGVQSIRSDETYLTHTLLSLESFTEYKIWLKAFSGNHEGEPSEPVIVQTDVKGPSQPRIVNLTCHNSDTLFLQWHRPSEFNRSIDLYFVYYRREDEWDFSEVTIATTSERLEHGMFLPNLTTDSMYEVQLRAATYSILNPEKICYGQFSESRKIVVSQDCDRQALLADAERTQGNLELSAGLVAALVCASFALTLVILAFILWRKFFQATYYYLDDGCNPHPPPTHPAWDGGHVIPSDVIIDQNYFDGKTKAYGLNNEGPIPIKLFGQHVAALHADGDIGFSKEYESVQGVACCSDLGSENSLSEDNKSKNRYLNIVAYDHTRVQLRPLPGHKRSADYINANFIDGFQQSRAYIGTQGPLPSTFDAFWRMIWEQRVAVIVMITNLIERGRRKCDMYWPKEGSEIYGIVQVTLVREEVRATYTVRTFTIKNLKVKRKKFNVERTVVQYHYTNWPDHGTPEHPLPILSFVRQSSAANPPGAGPIVVHCSAGVGRTGTYIVLDAMLKQIKAKGQLNIRGFLCHIRNQRNYLVQTEEQYVFIHDALLEAIQAGETNIHRSHISKYIQLLRSGIPVAEPWESLNGTSSMGSTLNTTVSSLNSTSSSLKWHLLDHEFHLVTSFIPRDFQLTSAALPVNVLKNRNAALVPVESGRVYLTPKAGIDGSDYINATWVQGYKNLRQFILTQHPLESTISDFWQMVWDHNAQTVIVLSDTADEGFPVFWPRIKADEDFENFRVRFVREQQVTLPEFGVNPRPGHVTQVEIAAQSLQDDYELHVRLILCPGWPYNRAAAAESDLFQLPKLVSKLNHNNNSPVVVVDRYGGTEAATLCSLTTILSQMETEQHVDIYMYAKLVHNKRPNIWSNRDDYMFLYRCAEKLHQILPGAVNSMPSSISLPLQLNCQWPFNGYISNLADSISLTSMAAINNADSLAKRILSDDYQDGHCLADIV